jgi:hypothetical protein
MSAFNDAWTLLKQRYQPQMSLLPFGFATGNPTQDALAYLGAGPGAQEGPMTVPYADEYASYQDFLGRQETRGVPRYQLDVTRDESGYRDHLVGLNPYLTADGQAIGRMPMAPSDTHNLRRDITRGRGRDIVAHTSAPINELITDYHGNTHFMDSTTSIPELAYYPTGSGIDDEHQGKGLYIRSLLSLLSTPEAMGLSAKDVAREDMAEGFNPEFDNVSDTLRGFNLSDADPELFNELYGQRGLISPPERTGGKGGSDRSHRLLSERYRKIMDLLGEDIHTYGEGQTLSNIVDMAERGEGMFGSHGGKLKHNLEEGSFGELRNPRTKEELLSPRGKTFFYDPISVDVGKDPFERETFGDLRRFDLAGLPVRVKRQMTPAKRKRLKQTKLEDFSQPEPEPEPEAPLPYPPPSRTPEEIAARRERARQRIIDREQRVQEAIDSLGDLFSSGQETQIPQSLRDSVQNARNRFQDSAAETASITGEEFNERLVNTERDVDIENSLKYFNEHVTERHFDEHGFAHPNSFDSLPEDMQINLARDIAFLEDIQRQNSRSDGVREALRRAADRSREEGLYDSYDYDTFFNPDHHVTNESMGGQLGAFRQNEIFKEIDKAITRVRILNHHLRTYPMELSGVGGIGEQEQAHVLLRNHLDDLFHPLGGYMMGYNEGRV